MSRPATAQFVLLKCHKPPTETSVPRLLNPSKVLPRDDAARSSYRIDFSVLSLPTPSPSLRLIKQRPERASIRLCRVRRAGMRRPGPQPVQRQPGRPQRARKRGPRLLGAAHHQLLGVRPAPGRPDGVLRDAAGREVQLCRGARVLARDARVLVRVARVLLPRFCRGLARAHPLLEGG